MVVFHGSAGDSIEHIFGHFSVAHVPLAAQPYHPPPLEYFVSQVFLVARSVEPGGQLKLLS